MRLARLVLHNFRCFDHLDLRVPPSMVIVGANGTGKSTLLQAIRCLVAGTDRDGIAYSWSDVVSESQHEAGIIAHLVPEHDSSSGGGLTPLAQETYVQGWFSDLSDAERTEWASYLDGDELVVAALFTVEARQRRLGLVIDDAGLARLRSYAGQAGEMQDWIDTNLRPWPNSQGGRWWIAAGAWALFEPERSPYREFTNERLISFPGPDQPPPSIGSVLKPIALYHMGRRVLADNPRARGAYDALVHMMATVPLIKEWAESATADLASAYSKILARYLPDYGTADFDNTSTLSDSALEVLQRALGDIEVALRGSESKTAVDPAILGAGARRAATLAALEVYSNSAMWDPSDWIILLVEEPEVGLHPAAQRRVARNLAALPTYGVQVFIVTHSAAVVAANPVERVRIARTFSGGESGPQSMMHDILAPSGRAEIAEILGTSPGDALMATVFVVVEGDSDAAVLESWAHRLGFSFANTGMRMLPAHGSGSVETVARALDNAYPQTRVIAILDNGSDTAKQKMTMERRFGDRVAVSLLSRTEIEGYFTLKAVAAWLQAQGVDPSLANNLGTPTKRTLRRLSEAVLHRPYREVADGLAIASLMTEGEIDAEVKQLLLGLEAAASTDNGFPREDHQP